MQKIYYELGHQIYLSVVIEKENQLDDIYGNLNLNNIFYMKLTNITNSMEVGNGLMINNDCLIAMDELIAQGVTVDAIITDPPY